MHLTQQQRNLIERVINTIETGKPGGDYGAIVIYADGPHDIRQITYGRAQTTEYGNLRTLVKMYVAAGGLFSAALAAYADKVGSVPLIDDSRFKSLLRDAGRQDPIMREIQDRFFEEVYFTPAMRWADDHGFVLPLSALVIYDSFIHSGGILWLLRQRFAENPPLLGGNEKNGSKRTSACATPGYRITTARSCARAITGPKPGRNRSPTTTGICRSCRSA